MIPRQSSTRTGRSNHQNLRPSHADTALDFCYRLQEKQRYQFHGLQDKLQRYQLVAYENVFLSLLIVADRAARRYEYGLKPLWMVMRHNLDDNLCHFSYLMTKERPSHVMQCCQPFPNGRLLIELHQPKSHQNTSLVLLQLCTCGFVAVDKF